MSASGEVLTYLEWQRRLDRRERLIRYGVALVAIVLPALVALVVVGLVLS